MNLKNYFFEDFNNDGLFEEGVLTRKRNRTKNLSSTQTINQTSSIISLKKLE